MPSASSSRSLAFALIVGSLLLRGWFMTTLPLSGDEAYHWEWSRHLAWAYHDHPGMTAWMIRASNELLGTTLFSTRLPALISLLVMWLVVWAFARDVARSHGAEAAGVERAGLFAVLFAQFAPIYTVFSIYISTDPAVLMFWSTSLWLGHRALRSGSLPAWVLFGISLGCAANSKFLAGLLVPSALLYLLIARGRAGRLPVVSVGLAVLIAAAMVAPLVLWNRDHDWSTFYFNFVSRQDVESHWHDVPVYAVGQALALSPVLFWLLCLGLRDAWRSWRRDGDRVALYLFCFTAVPLAYFLYVAFGRAVSPHWPVVAWISMVVWSSAAIGEGRAWARPGLQRWSLRISIGLTLLVGAVSYVPQRYLDYDLAWAGRPRKVRVKALAERYGWEELGKATGVARDELDAANGDRAVFVAASRYGLAATTSFYMPGRPTLLQWCSPRHHGDHYRFWDALSNHGGEDAVIVVKRRIEGELPFMLEHFDEVEQIERLDILDLGKTVTRPADQPAPELLLEVRLLGDEDDPEDDEVRRLPFVVRAWADGEQVPADAYDPTAAEHPFVIRSFWIVRCRGFDGEEPWERKWPEPEGSD